MVNKQFINIGLLKCIIQKNSKKNNKKCSFCKFSIYLLYTNFILFENILYIHNYLNKKDNS